MSRKIRIASVRYLNARPLTNRLDRDRFEVIEDIPANIARWLVAGEVDVALTPVAAVLSGDKDLRVVPGVAIGADGPVLSVLLAAETEPEAWTKVVLDGESRTSAVLARLLLAEGPLAARVAKDLPIEAVAPGTGPELARGTVATLVIGDAALALPERLGVRVDLAAMWKAWTGHPFLYAVWAGRPDLPADVVAALREAAAQGVAEIPTRYEGHERDYLSHHISYKLGDAELIGLRRFAALGFGHGWFGTRDLQVYGPPSGVVARSAGVDELLARCLDGDRLEPGPAALLARQARLVDLAGAASEVRRAHDPSLTVSYPLVEVVHLADGDAVAAAIARAELRGAHAFEVVAPASQYKAALALIRWLSATGRPVVGFSAEALGMMAEHEHLEVEDVALALFQAGLRGLADPSRGLGVNPRVAEILAAAHQAGLTGGADLMVGEGEGVEARLAHLFAVRALDPAAVGSFAVRAGIRRGLRSDGNTAADFLGTVALARLILPGELPVGLWFEGVEAATAWTALHAGSQSPGPLRLDGDEPISEVLDRMADWDRQISVAGFTPLRLGGPSAAPAVQAEAASA